MSDDSDIVNTVIIVVVFVEIVFFISLFCNKHITYYMENIKSSYSETYDKDDLLFH